MNKSVQLLAGPALALGSAPVLAQEAETSETELSGEAQCGVANQYYLQKVHVVVSDKAQGQCELGLTLDTDIGEFSVKAWETRNLDDGNRIETDYIAQYRPNDELALRVARYDLPGSNDITQLSVQHSLGELGSVQGEAFIRDQGQPGGALSYNFPKDKREFLGGDLVHGPAISLTKRPISGDELVNMRYNASLTWPVAENVSAILAVQAGAPLWADDNVDKDPQLQANFNLNFSF